MRAPAPTTERERLGALHAYGILDTPPERDFDDLARLAAMVCHTPTATLAFVDERREWLKANFGLKAQDAETARDLSFSAHTILESDMLVVPDAARDPRFADHALVQGPPHLRFYAAAPLIDSDGLAVGALAVVDFVPRQLSAEQLDALRTLGDQTVARLELRRSREMRCTHDLRGRILSANAAVALYSGYPREVLLRMTIPDLLVPEARNSFGQYLETVRVGGCARGVMRIQTATGDQRYWEYGSELLGELVSCGGRDVTDRSDIREELTRARTLMEAVIDSTSDAVYVKDLQGRYLLLNTAAEQLSGKDHRAIIGRDDTVIFSAAEASSVMAVDREVIESQETTTIEETVTLADGRLHTFLSTKGPIRNTRGAAVALFGIARDITERKRNEEAVRNSERRLRDVINGMGPSTLAALLTPDGRVVEVSQATLDAAGLSSEQVIGVLMDDIPTWMYSEEVRKRLRTAIDAAARGEPSRYDVGVPSADGTMIMLDFSLQPVRDEGGQVIFLVPSASVITDRKRVETALRESETRLRLLISASNIGLWVWTPATEQVYFSPEWKAQLGYRDDELPNRYEEWETRLHPEDRQATLDAVGEYLEGVRPNYDIEFRLRHRDGSWRTILARADVVRDEAGVPVRMMGCHVDITERRRQEDERIAERRRSEEELRQTEKRLRDLINGLGPSMFVGLLTLEGTILEANLPVLAAAGGLTLADVVGRRFDELYCWSYSREIQQQLREAMARARQGESSRYDASVRVAKDRFIEIDFSLQPLHDDSGAVVLLVPSASVVTERKEAEALMRLANARLRDLSSRLLTVQETERRELARELHDEVGQALTAIKINLQTQQQFPQAPSPSSPLDESLAIVDHVLHQVRALSLQLRPPMLDDFGLVAAIRWLVDQQAHRAGLQIQLRDRLGGERFHTSIETACFRIAQEAINNVVRHGSARNVAVDLTTVDGMLHLRVRDDGVGFDVSLALQRAKRGGSLGMTGMEDRAALVGGRIEWLTAPGEGTRVLAWFPCKRPPETGVAR